MMCISKLLSLLFPQPIPGKGLAMATAWRPLDLDALGVDWWEWYP